MNLIERWKAASGALSIKIQNIAYIVSLVGFLLAGLPEMVSEFIPISIDLSFLLKVGGVISGAAGLVTAIIAKLSSIKLPEQTK